MSIKGRQYKWKILDKINHKRYYPYLDTLFIQGFLFSWDKERDIFKYATLYLIYN